MKGLMCRDNVMDQHTGYLGTSRVVLNHFDVSTQADIQHTALSYESEDEIMGRLQKDSKGTAHAHYSKQDIREQYCISDRGLGALENEKQSLFGCLSSHQSSPCSTRASFLTACVKQKAPSDENLYELYKKHPSEYAPYPRRQRNPWAPLTPEMYRYDRDLKSSYFRRKPTTDPSRYTWMPSDDESIRMEKPRSILENSHQQIDRVTPPPVVPPGKKHVSFARSHTLTSFDDAMSSLSSSSSHLNRMTRSQERLLDVRKVENAPITRQPEPSENILILDKLKRAPMKTQATQTEAGLGRKPIPAGHINLSPRTIHRVKMVSQGMQTNGLILNGRKLTKSFSEAGSKFGLPPGKEFPQFDAILDHEPLTRTQSDEPPRSPFIVTSPPILPVIPPPEPPASAQEPVPSDSSSFSRSDEHESDSAESRREIFIDFEPQVPPPTTGGSRTAPRRPLVKTASDGAILAEQRRGQKRDDSVVPDKPLTSISHENIPQDEEDQRTFTPYFQKSPIRYEGICKKLEDNVYSSLDGTVYGQDSIDDEFHENLIYNKIYMREETQENHVVIYEGKSPNDESVVPSVHLMPDTKLSPFASNDSLTNDTRDQSDGIWNESQVTVLQVDSGTENGTALSSSEMTSVTSPGSANLLTPSSRRKHLLMLQHQQRSSMDTEALDEEFGDQETYPRIVVDKPTPKQLEPQAAMAKQQYLSARSASPIWQQRRAEAPAKSGAESPLPAVVPDLLLARTDSCKTNTDVSESTTTDDYVTANSGTDSSRKSGSVKQNAEQPTRPQLQVDDMVVPSFSPPGRRPRGGGGLSPVPSPCRTPVPAARTRPPSAGGRVTPSDDSSSCGSYSVGGSTPDLLDRFSVPSGSSKPCHGSDDERSVHYSSSGYYESPMEDDVTWRSPKHEDTAKKRRDFHLDLVGNPTKHSNGAKYKKPARPSPSNDTLKPGEPSKPKRSKSRTRSPMQSHRKGLQSRKASSPYRDQSSYNDDKDNKLGTSDDSSIDAKHLPGQCSPRKSKKSKDGGRRKSLPRSPTSQRSARQEKPSSLPGSLSRRRVPKPDGETASASPKPQATDARLKALSAESLRSVSPGSDSVFYSDPSSHTAEHQVHCLHCGKEVDIVTTDDPEKSPSSNGDRHDIVEPPAGFGDSPKAKPHARLFKKLERRLKSEERSLVDHRRHRYRPDVRAKSEERDAGRPHKCRLRPMARSASGSRGRLVAAGSSPSVLPAAEDDDDDVGVYDAPYRDGRWAYMDERDEVFVASPIEQDSAVKRDSISSTESEQEFRKKYQAVTHRMVHRKSCLEMYKRQNAKSFANGISSDPEEPPTTSVDLRQKLEEILKLMLVIWCRENKALDVISQKKSECDKTIIVRREPGGEFGFRIHGSKPVVVSAIEQATPAETSGLEVGDVVLAVNGVPVLDRGHSEVVRIAHAGSDTLRLEVARTCYALNNTQEETSGASTALYSGYLWKLSGYASGTATNKWIRRWFCLKQNNCLYYYKTDTEKQPVGVVMLFNHEVRKLADDEGGLCKPNRFVIQREDAVPLHLAADTPNARSRWVEVVAKAISDSLVVDEFLEETKRNLTLAPCAIPNPDCFGYLIKLGTQWKSWSRRYCVLKDACLYFYQDANAKNAFGVAYLQGYKVQQSLGSKKHAFEIVPPDPSKKHYYFHTESDADRKRWLAALEYSIDRWWKIQ